MGERGEIDFEPLVEFPSNPFDAARIYLGLMAYPESGAGQPGGQGHGFAEALWKYNVWSWRRAKGLRAVRQGLRSPDFQAPRLREFRGLIERGRRRLRRRFAAFDIVGNQMINAIVNSGIEAHRIAAAGKPSDAFVNPEGGGYAPIRQEIWDRVMMTPREVIRRNLPRWSERFDLKESVSVADMVQKERDLISRGFIQSRPVIHMAHGLNEILGREGDALPNLEKADFMLVFLWHA